MVGLFAGNLGEPEKTFYSADSLNADSHRNQ